MIASTLLRGFFVIALVSLFGTLVSRATFAREGEAGTPAVRRAVARLGLMSCLLALVLGVAWAAVEAAAIAGAESLGSALAAAWPVARETQFGHWMLIRVVLLLAALPFVARAGRHRAVALMLAGVALATQGAVGHAGAIGGRAGAVLLASEAVHLLAAGAWLGGLLPLLVLVRNLPPDRAAEACRRFFPVGLGAVVALAGTALVQGSVLIGSLAGLFGTTYGRVALLKLLIFVLLLGLAAINRHVLTGWLRDVAYPHAGQWLQASLVLEASLGVAVVLAAAFLASSAPAIDAMRP